MHIRGKRVITDEEALEAGKLTGSQSVTLGDVTRLYRYIRGKIMCTVDSHGYRYYNFKGKEIKPQI